MKKMKRALRLMRMTCNLRHYLMWICECGKIQKDMGFMCTCRILVCNYAKSLKYVVFINVSISN